MSGLTVDTAAQMVQQVSRKRLNFNQIHMDSEKNTGREKVTTGHKVPTSSAGRNQVHLCLIVTVVFGSIQRCCSCSTNLPPTGDDTG